MNGERQLPLPLAPQLDFARLDFLEAPSNLEVLTWLARQDHWPDHRLAVWGDAGCGKTHLLHRWAAAAGARLVPNGTRACHTPAIDPGPLALDDADMMAEEPLLH